MAHQMPKPSSADVFFNWKIPANQYSAWYDGYNNSKLSSPLFGPPDRSFMLKLHLAYEKEMNKDLVFIEMFNNNVPNGGHGGRDGGRAAAMQRASMTSPIGNCGGDNFDEQPLSLQYKLSTYGSFYNSEKPIKLYPGRRNNQVLIWTTDFVFPHAQPDKDKAIRCEFFIMNRKPKLHAFAPPFVPNNNDNTMEDWCVDPNLLKLGNNVEEQEVSTPTTVTTEAANLDSCNTNETSEISAVVDRSTVVPNLDEAQLEDTMMEQLADYAASLLKNGLFSDVTIVVGGQQFSLHKLILSARSPVFEDTFANSKDLKQIEYEDINLEVFQAFLNYIYAGDVSDVQQFASELMTLADKFEIKSLAKICEGYIQDELTTETACKILSLADQQGLDDLKQKAIAFINDNADEIFATNEWKEIIESNASLMVQLYKATLKNNAK